MTPSDIAIVKAEFKKLEFNLTQEKSIGKKEIAMKLLFRAGIVGIAEGYTALRLAFSLSTDTENYIAFEVEGTVTVAFKRRLEIEELKEENTYQVCFGECVSYLIEVIASNTGRMGMTPIILSRSVLDSLVKETIAKMPLAPMARILSTR